MSRGNKIIVVRSSTTRNEQNTFYDRKFKLTYNVYDMTMYALIALFEIEINFCLLFLCNIFFIKIDQFLSIREYI